MNTAMPAAKLSPRVERAAQGLHHASLRTEAVQRLVAGTSGQRTQRFAQKILRAKCLSASECAVPALSAGICMHFVHTNYALRAQ